MYISSVLSQYEVHVGFQLVPKSVTLNDLELRNGHYFALFYRIQQLWDQLRRVVEDRPILLATKT